MEKGGRLTRGAWEPFFKQEGPHSLKGLCFLPHHVKRVKNARRGPKMEVVKSIISQTITRKKEKKRTYNRLSREEGGKSVLRSEKKEDDQQWNNRE